MTVLMASEPRPRVRGAADADEVVLDEGTEHLDRDPQLFGDLAGAQPDRFEPRVVSGGDEQGGRVRIGRGLGGGIVAPLVTVERMTELVREDARALDGSEAEVGDHGLVASFTYSDEVHPTARLVASLGK